MDDKYPLIIGTDLGQKMATVTKRGDGQWQAKIRKTGYATISRTFATKAACEAWAKVTESEMIRGVFIDRSEAESTTMRRALERYRNEVTPAKRGATQERSKIAKLLRHPLMDRTLAQVHGKDIAKFRDEMLQSGNSPSTTVKYLALLSHLFNVANRDWGIGVVNPVTQVSKPTIHNERHRRLEGGEEARLLSALSTSKNPWMRPLVELAVETAMRQGELLGMTWKDVGQHAIHLPMTKNGKRRDVPLSGKAKTILAALPRSIDGKVFPTTATAVIQSWRRACVRAGIDDLHFHDLRHEATSRLASRFEMHELMKITGHSSSAMLARYYHPSVEDLAKKMG